MSAPEFTPEGISVQTFDEIFDQLVTAYKAIYGADTDFDSESPDGQRLGILAKAILDGQSFGVSMYNSLDPDLASGLALDRTIKYSGINRRPATRSQWDITVTASAPVDIAAGYTIVDDLGQEWATADDRSLITGANTATFLAVTWGAVTGTTGATLQQVTVEPLITALDAPGDALVGIEEETDPDLRARRNRSLENPAYSTIGSLFAKLADLSGVTGLEIYENDTDDDDLVLPLDAHSYWVVIEGGTVADIVETMTKQKTGGTGRKGSVCGQYVEIITTPGGVQWEKIHTQCFDRPLSTDIYVKVTATRRDSAVPIDTVLLAQKIADHIYKIGQDANASELYCDGYQAGSTFILSGMQISLTAVGGYTDGQLDAGAQDKFTIDAANVDVTEVI